MLLQVCNIFSNENLFVQVIFMTILGSINMLITEVLVKEEKSNGLSSRSMNTMKGLVNGGSGKIELIEIPISKI